MKKTLLLLLLSCAAMAQSVYTPTEWKAFTSKTVQPRYIASVPASSYKQAPDYLFNGSYGTALIANYQTRGDAVLYIKTTSAFTITLSNVPDFVVGKRLVIKDQSGGTPNVTVQSHSPGSIPIDGLSSVNLTSPNGEWVVYCTGSAWTIQQTNFVAAAPPSGGYKWMRQDDCNNVSWQPLPTAATGGLDGDVLLIKDGTIRPFDSIYEANDSAAVGSTIVLLKDLTLTTGIELTEGVSVDGNGKSITIGGSGDVDLFWTQAGETRIYNFKKIKSTRSDANPRWLFAVFGGSKMFVEADEIEVAQAAVGLCGAPGSELIINAKKIYLGTYINDVLNGRKFFVNNNAKIKVMGASITDDGTTSNSYGWVASSVNGGQLLANAGDTLRSVMEFENVNMNVSRAALLIERSGEAILKNVKINSKSESVIRMLGDPYVTNSNLQNYYEKLTMIDCQITGGSSSGGIWPHLFYMSSDNTQGFDVNFQDVYLFGSNYFHTNSPSGYSIYTDNNRYPIKNYGIAYYNGNLSSSLTWTYNQPVPLGATLVGGGSVTSVGVSVPSGLSVTGSPVTSSGTIGITTALSGMLKGTGSGFTTATSGTDYIAGGVGTAGYIPKFASIGVIGNSIMQDLGTQIVINGGADAFKVISSGAGVTEQLEQTSNNDVLYRFKRNGGSFWDLRYYYTGEAFKLRYNDADKFTFNTDGSANFTGGITIGAALGLAYGGTGQTTANDGFNALAPSQTGHSGKFMTTDGTNTSWASVTAGTVSSVALALPSIFSLSGSPISTSGTLSATLASQTANTVFAAPNGSSGAPTFRAMAAADLPSYSNTGWSTYSRSLTWTGTPPSGATGHQYKYVRIGNMVWGWIRLEFASGGSSNTVVTINTDDFPVYEKPSNAGSAEFMTGCSGLMDAALTGNPPACRSWIEESSNTSGFVIRIQAAAQSTRIVFVSFNYTTN